MPSLAETRKDYVGICPASSKLRPGALHGICVAGWFRRWRALRFRAWEHNFLYFTEPNGFGYSRARKFYRVERPSTKPAKYSHKYGNRAEIAVKSFRTLV